MSRLHDLAFEGIMRQKTMLWLYLSSFCERYLDPLPTPIT